MGAEEKKEKKELYNPNLISLKCVLFLFFGGNFIKEPNFQTITNSSNLQV